MKSIVKASIKKELKLFLLFIVFSLLLISMQGCSEDNIIEDPCVVDPSSCYPQIEFDYQSVVDTARVQRTQYNYYEDGSAQMLVEFFDVQNGNNDKRPLILLAPGGAYVRYTQIEKLQAMSLNLAKRGYAVGIVKYATAHVANPDVWVKSILDMKVAVRYFKKNALDFKIDPQNIFTGGWSTGGQVSMYAAHLSSSDLDGLEQEFLKEILMPAIDQYGFEPTIYLDYNDEVKGTLLMMPYVFDPGVIDQNGPAIMLLGHQVQHFLDNQIIMQTVTVNGITQYGPDLMREQILSVGGYRENENFHYKIMENDLNVPWNDVNAEILSSENYDEITNFFYQNLD